MNMRRGSPLRAYAQISAHSRDLIRQLHRVERESLSKNDTRAVAGSSRPKVQAHKYGLPTQRA